ncbi:MAG: hypothetical protein SVK08_13340 [Halobacteriota archaeon]|nr:hypothetical protein [Halobacteriota archaeon]
MTMLKLSMMIEKNAGTFQDVKALGSAVSGLRRWVNNRASGTLLGKEVRSIGKTVKKAPKINPHVDRLEFYRRALKRGAGKQEIPPKYWRHLGID